MPKFVRRNQKPKVAEPKDATATEINNAKDFFIYDDAKTLFPMRTNRILVEYGSEEIEKFIEKCLDYKEQAFRFLPQQRVYAAKPGHHLRRTVKLDPVAEYFIYKLIFENRTLFKKPFNQARSHYGYRFSSGQPISPTEAYKAFRSALAEYGKIYKYSMSFDVASYFNGVYHHDLVSWFAESGAQDDDVEALGQFLREIKSGRSVDCLPQGLYPTKMIGNDFLRFVEQNFGLQNEKLVRFMDDITIFANDEVSLLNDFELIQRLLGEKGLSVNPRKTKFGDSSHQESEREVDKVRANLLRRRNMMIVAGYEEDGTEKMEKILVKFPLSKQESDYIQSILHKPELEDDDADIMLTFIADVSIQAEKRLPEIIEKFPHLAKSVFNFCNRVKNKDFICDTLIGQLRSARRLSEFELFWYGWILDTHLLATPRASELIQQLLFHRNATLITKAKVLEVEDQRFGLPEYRDQYLVSGQSDWLAWASAVGSRGAKKITRNHKMKYFGASSNINHLISKVMSEI